jgi:hypothetical protein
MYRPWQHRSTRLARVMSAGRVENWPPAATPDCVSANPSSWLLLGVTLMIGCSAPARRLPQRVVDDPITLPRRMAEIELTVGGPLTQPVDRNRWERASSSWAIGPSLTPVLRYGISDRVTLTSPTGVDQGLDGHLTLTGPTTVTVALLDDAPARYAATGWCAPSSPLGLSLTLGVDPLYREIGQMCTSTPSPAPNCASV